MKLPVSQKSKIVIDHSMDKKIISVKRSTNINQYDIEIVGEFGDIKCQMIDTIDSVDLVDAYEKASQLASKLSEKIDRENAFIVVQISRSN